MTQALPSIVSPLAMITPGTLKPEIKAEWLKRLRSGEYPQGRTELNGRNGLCCLGVLCEIAAEQGIVRKESAAPGRPIAYITVADEDAPASEVWTPEAVARWALEESSFVNLDGDQIVDYPWRTSITEYGSTVSLAQLNDRMEDDDTHAFDFHAIANQIEKDY